MARQATLSTQKKRKNAKLDSRKMTLPYITDENWMPKLVLYFFMPLILAAAQLHPDEHWILKIQFISQRSQNLHVTGLKRLYKRGHTYFYDILKLILKSTGCIFVERCLVHESILTNKRITHILLMFLYYRLFLSLTVKLHVQHYDVACRLDAREVRRSRRYSIQKQPLNSKVFTTMKLVHELKF